MDDIDRSKLQKWECSNHNSQELNGITLSDDYIPNAKYVTSFKENFSTILKIFECHKLVKLVLARRRFSSAKMVSDEKELAYINSIKKLACTRNYMGNAISDPQIAMTMLCGLPPRFANLISELDAIGDAPSTVSIEFTEVTFCWSKSSHERAWKQLTSIQMVLH